MPAEPEKEIQNLDEIESEKRISSLLKRASVWSGKIALGTAIVLAVIAYPAKLAIDYAAEQLGDETKPVVDKLDTVRGTLSNSADDIGGQLGDLNETVGVFSGGTTPEPPTTTTNRP